MKRILPFLALFAVAPLQAQWCIGGCASEITQVLNKIQLVDIQLNTYRHYIEMLKHSQVFGNLPWTKIDHDIAVIEQNMRRAQAISAQVAQVAAIYRSKYPGYGKLPGIPFQMKYATWNATSMDTLEGVLAGMQEQHAQMTADIATDVSLRDALMGSEGLLKSQQAIGGLIFQSLAETKKMRQLQMAQMSAVVATEGMRLQEEADAKAAEADFFHFEKQQSGNQGHSVK